MRLATGIGTHRVSVYPMTSKKARRPTQHLRFKLPCPVVAGGHLVSGGMQPGTLIGDVGCIRQWLEGG